jgi:hypothetical protein
MKMFGDKEVDERSMSRKWVIVNDEVAHNGVINCITSVEVSNIGLYLCNFGCKRENKIRKKNTVYSWRLGGGGCKFMLLR